MDQGKENLSASIQNCACEIEAYEEKINVLTKEIHKLIKAKTELNKKHDLYVNAYNSLYMIDPIETKETPKNFIDTDKGQYILKLLQSKQKSEA